MPDRAQEIEATLVVGVAPLRPPTSIAKTVTQTSVEDGGGANPVTGYGLVEAADIDAAVEMAKGCPVVTLGGGSVEVAETFEIDMG